MENVTCDINGLLGQIIAKRQEIADLKEALAQREAEEQALLKDQRALIALLQSIQ
jgi:hypothetical protein